MSRSICILQEQILLYEENIPKDPQISQLIETSDSVKRIIDLSKKYFTSKLSKEELKEAEHLFKDPKVERLLKAAEKVGQRNGWISGGIYGSIAGSIVGGILSIGTAAPFFALVLLGAIIGGLSIGFLTSRIVGILTRWKTEESLTKGDQVRIHT